MILIFVHVAFVFECFVGAFARTMLRSYSPSTEPTTCHITVTVTLSIIVARVAKKYAAEGVSWQYGCFLKWWTLKWSFLVGKPMVVGHHHFWKQPYTTQKRPPILRPMFPCLRNGLWCSLVFTKRSSSSPITTIPNTAEAAASFFGSWKQQIWGEKTLDFKDGWMWRQQLGYWF